MNIGYIYKITNLVNGKMYIGQTSKTIEKRFKEHLRDSKRKNKASYNYPLYVAIRKYGEENFIIESIEKCFIEELDEKEIFWIKYFNTYNNGYNATLGGSGGRLLDLDEKKIINEYEKIGRIIKVAKINNCSSRKIKDILDKNNVKAKSSIEHAKDKGLTIQRFSLDNILLEEYDTLVDAGLWLLNSNLVSFKSLRYARTIIKWAIVNDDIFCGFIWKSNLYNEEIKKIEKEKMEKMRKKPRNNIHLKPKNICPLCNKNQKLKSAHYCKECNNKLLSDQFAKEREEKISRKELKSLIRTTPFTKIGEQFGVSDNAIRKWCKSYGLPSKSSEIKKYTDKEWEKI